MNRKYFAVLMMSAILLSGCGVSPKEDRRVLSVDDYTYVADIYTTPAFNGILSKTARKNREGFVTLSEDTKIIYEWVHKEGEEPLGTVFWSGTDMKFAIPASYNVSQRFFRVVQDTLHYFEHFEQFPAGDEEKLVSPEVFSYAPVGTCLEPKLEIYDY